MVRCSTMQQEILQSIINELLSTLKTNIMGSVLSRQQCPNCGQEMDIEYFYRTSELWQACSFCGYYYSFFWKKDDAGQLVPKPNPTGSQYWQDQFESVEERIDKPYGRVILQYDDVSHSSTLVEPLTAEQVDEILHDDKIISGKISRWYPERKEIKVEVIKEKWREPIIQKRQEDSGTELPF
jgi:hypothetical protein